MRHSSKTRRLLICSDWFFPAVRAGGPVSSIRHLTDLIGGDVEVRVLTSDRDLGENKPFATVALNSWTKELNAAVVYYTSGFGRMLEFVRCLRRWNPEAVYLNSMFSLWGTILPLAWMKLTFRRPRRVLAPRGMLRPTALAVRPLKKWIFLLFARGLALFEGLEFHATSSAECEEIRRVFPKAAVTLVSNVPCQPVCEVPARDADVGVLRIASIGRIHPIKNTHLVFDILRQAGLPCELKVVGPEEDADYGEECRRRAAGIAECVTTEFCGVKSGDEVRGILQWADLMLLPTQGENFGHAIFESLAVGTPVLISDQTMWRELASQSAGWDLSLDDLSSFSEALQEFARMDPATRHTWRRNAHRIATEFVATSDLRQDYLDLFFGATPFRATDSKPH